MTKTSFLSTKFIAFLVGTILLILSSNTLLFSICGSLEDFEKVNYIKKCVNRNLENKTAS